MESDLPFLPNSNIGKSASALVAGKSLLNLVDSKVEKTICGQDVSSSCGCGSKGSD